MNKQKFNNLKFTLIKNTIIITIATFLFVYITISFAQYEMKPSHVVIKKVEGKYHFFVNGKQFDIKGVGGEGRFALLHESGGNSFRTWGSYRGLQILDSAKKYDMMIAMGLGMRQQLHGFDYNDSVAVAEQFERIKKSVDEFKNHPNLLCWVAGNELNLMSRGESLNPKVYDALKEVVDYIHKTDPNHPVTTAFAGVDAKAIHIALEHCPELDFLSLQVYGGLEELPEAVKAAGITKPFAITEFGPRGHWEVPKTKWGREIEEPSAVKATGIAERIQKAIVNDPTGLCLGGYAFVWGQKQERTPTWYGMFIKTGEATAIVDELTKYWTGKYPSNRAPEVDSLTLDGKEPIDNVYIKPGSNCIGKVYAFDPDGDPITYQWIILKEVKVRSQGGAHEDEPGKVDFETISDQNGELNFKAPAEEGEYRLFCYVYDGKNKVGTANFPFYVK